MKILQSVLAAVTLIAVSACCTNTSQIKRVGMVTGLRPEKADYYRSLHAKPWPGVMKRLKQCNVQNYSIFETKIDGRPYLFSYFEYTGSDFDADMKKMAGDAETVRWWKETDPCQRPLPGAAAKGKIWTEMDSVFFLK